MSALPRRLLLTSIHDVSPRFEGEIDRLLDVLAPQVGMRLAMLVVPNHWGDAPLVPGSPFARRLRGWADAGVEMFLHGFTHRDAGSHAGLADQLRGRLMTASEGEFLGLSRHEASRLIVHGRALVEEVIGRSIDGFVAPAWLYGRGTLEALDEHKVAIAEDHFRVWSPASGEQLARGPVITWASRSKARLASSLVAAALLRRAPIEVLRIGVHPPDVRHPRLMRSIARTLAVAGRNRRPAANVDLLNAGSSRIVRHARCSQSERPS